jgi:phosphoglycerate kinase
MFNFRTLEDLGDVRGKNVIVATNFDVPIENEEVLETYRVKAAVPTIKNLIERGARVILVSHLGRPNGPEDNMSLMPVRFELGKHLNMHIKFAHLQNCRNSIIFMEDGEVLLLENMRFYKEELSKDEGERQNLIKELASLAYGFVNDAFASYRPSASTYDLALAVENRAAGTLMVKEVEKLTQLREAPVKPYVAVIGGAKLDTKIDILRSLVGKADTILIGGAMAYTFMKASGCPVGNSKIDEDMLQTAKEILEKAKQEKTEILLPVDHICTAEFKADAERVEVDSQNIPDGLIGMDIGERTLANYSQIIQSAKTILWNGPMGVFEWKGFERGTEAIGEYIGLSASEDAYKIAGGGDTIVAMEKLKINMKNFAHVSTGGGAMLAFLAGEELPVLQPLIK